MSDERWHASITPLIISANGDLERPQLHTSPGSEAHRCLAVCKVGPVIHTLNHGLDALIFPSLSPSSSMGHAFNCLHSPVDLIVKVADFPPI